MAVPVTDTGQATQAIGVAAPAVAVNPTTAAQAALVLGASAPPLAGAVAAHLLPSRNTHSSSVPPVDANRDRVGGVIVDTRDEVSQIIEQRHEWFSHPFDPHEYELNDSRGVAAKSMKSNSKNPSKSILIETSPFDSIVGSRAQLKHTSIALDWNRNVDASSSSSLRQGAYSAPPKDHDYGGLNLQVGQNCQPRWFTPPPKIQVIPGVLGVGPLIDTRGAYPEQLVSGDGKVSCNGGDGIHLQSQDKADSPIPMNPSFFPTSANFSATSGRNQIFDPTQTP